MKSDKLVFFMMILMFGCLPQISSDIYTPSLPSIAVNLSTSINAVQWSMAIYMLGLALSQLIYGPLSEGLGRRVPLLLGLMIMSVGSIVCLFAPSIQVLLLGRLIQGSGAGACSAIWRSAFRDVFVGEDLAKYGGYFGVFITWIVPAAPMVGGYLDQYLGWRSIFAVLAGYAVLTAILVFAGFKETSQHHHLERLNFKFIASTYKYILTHRAFLAYTACVFLSYGAFFAWFTAGPILLIHVIGLTPVQFGWITLLSGGISTALAGMLNGYMVKRFGMPFMLRFGWSIMICAGLLMLTAYYIVGMNTLVIIVPVILFYFGVTFIWPSAFASAFTPFGEIAGYAGALYGSIQIGGAAVIGGLISHLPDQNQVPLALVFILSASLAWAVFELVANGGSLE